MSAQPILGILQDIAQALPGSGEYINASKFAASAGGQSDILTMAAHSTAPIGGIAQFAGAASAALVQRSEIRSLASSLEERFREQASKWRRETEHLSSPTQMMMHPSYQAILGMAQENKNLVIRLLLRDLQRNRSPWFWALSYLTQDNPIKQADAGKIDKMIKAWMEWGKERELL